jgi:hypothetical protein
MLLMAAGLMAQTPAPPQPAPATESVTEQKSVTADETSVPPPPVKDSAKATAPAASVPPASPAPSAAPAPADNSAPDIKPLLQTVKANFDKGNFDAADKAVEMALNISPNDFDAVKYQALIDFKLGKYEEAGQYFKLALTAGNKIGRASCRERVSVPV